MMAVLPEGRPDMELTRAVGENIKRIRKSKKLSMERLAAEAGVSRSMLGQIERGEANPSVGIVGNFPYDDITRIESYFLDLYISAHYIPEPSIPGCICYATVVSGTVSMTAQGQTFQLIERGALRFAADQPYSFENMTNATARLVLIYQYLK